MKSKMITLVATIAIAITIAATFGLGQNTASMSADTTVDTAAAIAVEDTDTAETAADEATETDEIAETAADEDEAADTDEIAADEAANTDEIAAPAATEKAPAAAPVEKAPVAAPAPAAPVTTADKLADAMSKNPDAFGWLTIDNTIINHPLVQGPNNDYYLNRDAAGNASSAGAIALDASLNRNLNNTHNILYGHNQKSNGRGFSELIKFKDANFFNSHTGGTLTTSSGTYRLEIFAVRVVSAAVDPFAWYPKSIDAFEELVDGIADTALFSRPVDLAFGDQILTLVTCSSEFANARTMVHAKMIKIG